MQLSENLCITYKTAGKYTSNYITLQNEEVRHSYLL